MSGVGVSRVEWVCLEWVCLEWVCLELSGCVWS